MSPSASIRVSNVLAPMHLRCALSLAKAISIGLRSGEKGGRNRNQHLHLLRACATRWLLLVDRLSRMTTVPGSKAGARWVSI